MYILFRSTNSVVDINRYFIKLYAQRMSSFYDGNLSFRILDYNAIFINYES